MFFPNWFSIFFLFFFASLIAVYFHVAPSRLSRNDLPLYLSCIFHLLSTFLIPFLSRHRIRLYLFIYFLFLSVWRRLFFSYLLFPAFINISDRLPLLVSRFSFSLCISLSLSLPLSPILLKIFCRTDLSLWFTFSLSRIYFSLALCHFSNLQFSHLIHLRFAFHLWFYVTNILAFRELLVSLDFISVGIYLLCCARFENFFFLPFFFFSFLYSFYAACAI